MSIHKETLDDELYGVLDSSPYSSTITQISAQSFFQEGFELSLDAIIPSIELTGSFTQFKSKTQLYIYDYSKTIIYSDKDYEGKGSYLYPPTGTSTTTQTSSIYNQFELNPTEDIYNQGYSDGRFFAVYNFIDYELGSDDKSSTEPFQDNLGVTNPPLIITNPYFIKDISGDRTELRIQNNFLTSQQIETYYNNFKNKLDARENVDEFYISFDDNENFIGINIQLELALPNSSTPTSILIKLYKPLPDKFKVDQKIQIITKVGETQVFEVEFKPNLVFIDDLFSLKGPNYNISIKDKVNNSTNFKNLEDLINTNSSESYYQFNSLQDQKGIIIRKNWGDWNEFVKYSLAEQRLRNFRDKMGLIESSSAEIASLQTITGPTTTTIDYSASINAASNNINTIIKKFDSYEYFLYYITGSESWPKYTSTYPYTNYSVTSSEANNWFGDTDEQGIYFNTGKNQIYSASRYDNDNQDNLYYLIPSFITQNISNEQYIKFVSMVGQTFDEIYLYTEAVEQIRNTNSNLTGSVLPLGMADDVIESLGFDTSGNDFSPIGFNVNGVGTFPSSYSGLEYITRYIDIASGSVINYYDQEQSTLGYIVALSDPSFPYPLENTAQEIYRRIFHNMISLVKRKGTVTGLRQLINIWGVPNTMLRISEFGGKNKNDENDYDEWMNRYSTAFNSYPTPFTASNTIDTSYFGQVNATAMFPWLPLVGNYKETAATPDVAVPDCIQFRFKTATHVDGTTNISESLLLKRGQNGGTTANIWAANGDFGIYLHQSGSQSGSYSGSIDPFDNNFASMSFVISGSLAQGATSYASGQAHCYVTSPIYLPFYNKEWWTVQLQRKTHISASNQNATLNEFELRVGQNIYEGYDGNQIGWVASSSLTMSNAVISQSMNESWNRMYRDTTGGGIMEVHNYNDSQVYLPGNILKHPSFQQSNAVGKQASYFFPGFDLGVPMSGSFQEFRYYRRALSASAFNDFVMNPKSIQGHGNRNYGPGSSYDLLSYRVPLGNELEFIEPNGTASYIDATTWATNIRQFSFGKLVPTNANGGNSQGQSIGSVHPSAINYDTSRLLYTGSFCIGAGSTPSEATDPYFLAFRFADNPNLYITSSYITANNEIIYMDQPSAGIRNRISNKIQVIDKNEYGTTLSPFRSIQQEYEQSGSYTEDINSLEVGFSFQNEINDDIIATFGHGVVSDAIADPRFTSESSDRYPELTRIAEDYFKKYQGFTINSPSYSSSHSPSQVEREYDYKRLIKFYETSLFKAIKNYIPARTSLSTGIIVKQHLLERNRAISSLGITTETPIAKTPETGSNSSGYTTQTGFNSGISNKNLEITSSIGTYSLTGSAGGSVNKYNNLEVNTPNFNPTQPILRISNTATIPLDFYGTDLTDTNPNIGAATNNMAFDYALDNPLGGGFFETFVAYEGQLSYDFTIAFGSNTDIDIEIRSDKRGVISTFAVPINNFGFVPKGVSPVFNIYPNEKIKIFAFDDGSGITLSFFDFEIGSNPNSPLVTIEKLKAISASQQVNWYIDNFTGEYKVDDHQTEFYNGEFSGSEIATIPPQYNPYRKFYNNTQGNYPEPYVDFTQGGGNMNLWTVLGPNSIQGETRTAGYPGSLTYNVYTGSFFNLIPGVTYLLNFSISPVPGKTLSNGMGVINYYNSTYSHWLGSIIEWDIGGAGTYDREFTATNLNPGNPLYQPHASGPGSGFDNGGAGLSWYSNDTRGFILEIHSITVKDEQYFYPNDAFTIIPSQSLLFQNSPYNPLINNVSGSRKSSFLFDQDFDPTPPGNYLKEGIPNDYALTVSASQLGFGGANSTNVNLLEYSEIPDSNYTAKAIITPRYEGSKMISADYNFGLSLRVLSASISSTEQSPLMRPGLYNKYTGERKIQFLDGSTGSWEGDSTGKYPSAVDSRPIYFAHFKSSYENLEKYNTSTFNIDQLIQVPFESIQSEQAPIITSSQLTGNNKNLLSVGSTFTPNRKVKAIYNQSSKQFRNLKKFTTPSSFTTISPILDYTTMDGSSNYITFPAQEIISYYTNEKTEQTVVLTHSINAPIWVSQSINYINPVGSSKPIWQIMNTRNNFAIGSVSSFLTASIQPLPVNTPSASTSLLVTGSSPMGDSLGYGLLYLQGMSIMSINLYQYNYQFNPTVVYGFDVVGPHLQLINTINTNIDIGDISYSTSQNPYLFPDGTVNTELTNSCAQWVPNDDGAAFGAWPFVVSSEVYDPIDPLIASQDRKGGGLPSFPTNPLKSIARKGIQNYFTYNYSMSALTEYPQKSLPIMIERGDVIRVSYAYPLTLEAASNTSVTNEIITQDFEVLGYEQAPPGLLFSRPTEYDGLTELGWGSNNTQISPANHFQALAQNLPPTGMFSPDSLKERFDLLATNGQKVLGIGSNTDDLWARVFSGSIIDCVVETRWGELSGSSTTVATTGSIKVTFAGEKAGFDKDAPMYIYTVQEILRTTMYGNPGTFIIAPSSLNTTTSQTLAVALASFGVVGGGYDPAFIFDTLKVTPDPSKLKKPIPKGAIMAATFIKRQDNDTKVIVDLVQPPESIGALTPSGDGYLIPDDLTETQKDNVQKIINVLKSQNSFTNPPDTNAANDVG